MDEQLRLLTGAYALNALEPQEARAFEQGADAEAQAEARELSEVAALLADGAPLEAPPARLKASVMEQIRRTPQLAAADRPAHTVEPVASSPVQPDSSRRPRARRSSAAGPRLRRRAAAGLAAVLLVAGGWTAGTLTQQQTAAGMMTQVAAAEDAAMAAGVMDGSNVSVTYSRTKNMAVSSSMLPPPPPGKVYMLWLFDADGNVTAMGQLSAAPNSTTPAMGELKGGLAQAREFGITVESPGATEPSYKPFMLKTRA